MATVAIALVVGLAGMALAALLLVKEPDQRVRLAAAGGAVGGFVVALLLALAAGTDVLAAVATALIGGAVLALVLMGQWRFFRSLFARQGRKL